MPTVKLTGILTDIFPIETRSNFTKRSFWLKEPDTERYPQHWEIELHNADVERLKGMESGDRLEVEVEIRGHKYTDRAHNNRVFVSLKCIGLRVVSKLAPPPAKQGELPVNPAPEDDLPF